jgi:hypothetical protein
MKTPPGSETEPMRPGLLSVRLGHRWPIDVPGRVQDAIIEFIGDMAGEVPYNLDTIHAETVRARFDATSHHEQRTNFYNCNGQIVV